jgi:hypothetical protein
MRINLLPGYFIEQENIEKENGVVKVELAINNNIICLIFLISKRKRSTYRKKTLLIWSVEMFSKVCEASSPLGLCGLEILCRLTVNFRLGLPLLIEAKQCVTRLVQVPRASRRAAE